MLGERIQLIVAVLITVLVIIKLTNDPDPLRFRCDSGTLKCCRNS